MDHGGVTIALDEDVVDRARRPGGNEVWIAGAEVSGGASRARSSRGGISRSPPHGAIVGPEPNAALIFLAALAHDSCRSLCSRVRQRFGPHVRTWAWWSSRSSSAPTAAASLRSFPQSSTGRLDVISVDADSYRRMTISRRSSAAV